MHSENPPDIASATAKFITKYIPRVRRLRFLVKMIIVTTLKVTIVMLSVISRLSQVKHSGLDGENILKYDRNVWLNKSFITLKYVSFDILLLQIFNQLSRRDCYGTMPYVVIMLPRELIVAITEQVFFEICRDASWKRNEHEKRKMSLTWIISKVRWNVRLLQKINCFNFGSINAQKNKCAQFMLIIYALICQVKANCRRLTGIQSNIFTSNRVASKPSFLYLFILRRADTTCDRIPGK